jgi:alkanesulfonate monooxygenase SsuD/methylene tetrahydromethanopterin reductase-like flavin-dependent oxidoreductase (luciferase family)
LKFAHFSHVWAKAGLSPAQRYEQLWRELELCDQLGFDYGFCVEHHFRPDESLMSAPQLFTIAAGARTRKYASAAWAISCRCITRFAWSKNWRSRTR